MVHYNITLNQELADIVDREMKKKKYSNRSEFFRDLVRRQYLAEEDYSIEEILPGDPDYKFLQSLKKKSKSSKFKVLNSKLNATKLY
ncbi:MAG: hypothetical protein A2V81_03950 [Candidatus Abawacabacteria bacterium RBG_16_42_10]|uniref:Ribbon-helix-helix protein CopG domain-containing protein n=1 Tax=Candidatus Abawacabacteria bacterium RBG_16_42_10 TaxID=1817814 RepID=A0A1F4XNG5_9BACT|nr:MAG: hypothetical protein A2V81_03950 [Candidatus Abawacabacteria bacterium RBG_16_42_10]